MTTRTLTTPSPRTPMEESPMRGIIDLDIDPTPWCPICGDTGEVEDDEGFFTDCICTPENDEPWIIPANADHAHLPRLGLDTFPSVGV